MITNDSVPALHIVGPTDGVIALSGELDMASAPQLEAAVQRLVDAGAQHATIDVSDLTFCDSTGLGVFVATNNKLPAGLSLRRPSPQLLKLLHTTGLEAELDFC